MTCPHCSDRIAELEDEVRHLQRELGQAVQEGVVDRISHAMRHKTGMFRPGAARVVALLWSTKGRSMSRYAILEACPPVKEPHADPLDRGANLVAVWVTFARKCLGPAAIETIYGKGYRLTPEGMAAVDAILGLEDKSAPGAGQGVIRGLTSVPIPGPPELL